MCVCLSIHPFGVVTIVMFHNYFSYLYIYKHQENPIKKITNIPRGQRDGSFTLRYWALITLGGKIKSNQMIGISWLWSFSCTVNTIQFLTNNLIGSYFIKFLVNKVHGFTGKKTAGSDKFLSKFHLHLSL